MEVTTLSLDLRTPLFYTQESGLDPFDPTIGEDDEALEFMFCFELNGEQSQRIDPQADTLFSQLVFSGRGGKAVNDKAMKGPTIHGSGSEPGSLPAGLYLFTQQRMALGQQDIFYLAAELQKDGLWEKYRLENRLYLRRLYEDGSRVTQLFRPCSE